MTKIDPAAALTGGRRALWLALLIAASVAFTLGFACAMPFAALGAASAMTLERRDGVLLTGGAWLANQVVGFALLNYPRDGETLIWGFVLGGVAILTTVSAQAIARRLDGHRAVVIALAAFIGAFAVYEGGLFLVSATLLGGTEDFVPAIVARIFEINAAAFLGLLALSRLAVAGGLIAGSDPRFQRANVTPSARPVLSAGRCHRVG